MWDGFHTDKKQTDLRKRLVPLLLLTIFVEGYIVLSAELLSIRLTLPFVDNATDTVSVLIAAVLMPLAFGYYAGGKCKRHFRRRLIQNLLVAGSFLTLGLSYVVLHHFFGFLVSEASLRHRVGLTTLYALTFLVVPVYLLGQTIPLVSAYFPHIRLHEAAGKILFLSTLGSFLGAVFTTLILMNVIGVAATATVTIAAISSLVVLLSKKRLSAAPIAAIAMLAASITLNTPSAMKRVNAHHSNAYNTYYVETDEDERYLYLNRVLSSGINLDEDAGPSFAYVEHIEHNLIGRFRTAGIRGRILVLGAGGFTIGMNDTRNSYTFIDIDPDLKTFSESFFLEKPLGENKVFIAEPARGFLNRTQESFDLIIIDLYRGLAGAPEHLITREFFMQVQRRLAKNGIVAINQHATPLMDDRYSRSVDDTIRSVFPYINRTILSGHNPWNMRSSDHYASILYIGRNMPAGLTGGNVYTDNLNSVLRDKKKNVPY